MGAAKEINTKGPRQPDREMMRYRYHSLDWRLITGLIVVIVVVLLLLFARSSMVEIHGPKEVKMPIKANESILFNATIKSQPGARSYSNYSWYGDGRNIFRIEEVSNNFQGRFSRFPLDPGETRILQFKITLIAENPPEGRYHVDFHLEAPSGGKMRQISNTYRLWIELVKPSG